jgi:ATP-binding cassette subfamily B protein
MTWVSLICVPVGAICYILMTIFGMKKWYKNYLDKVKALNDASLEYLNGIEVVKAFGKEKKASDKYIKAANEAADSCVSWMFHSQPLFQAAYNILPATLITILPFGLYFVEEGTISIYILIMFIIIGMDLITPLMTLFSYGDDLSQMNIFLKDITSILEMPEMKRPHTLNHIIENNNIRFGNVSFSYGDKEVLHDVSINFKENSVNALVGPSGGGKTTIAKLIAGYNSINKGSINIGNVDINDIPLDDNYKMVAFVSQDTYLFNMSVLDNIRIAKHDATDEEIIEICKKAKCDEFISKLENGYKTNVGHGGSHLSGGEKQRISIARAMLKDAPIIILDEATAYTDPENEAIIEEAISHLIKGKTLIMIAHRLSTITTVDNIVVVNNGHIEASGTHNELLNNCNLYKSMYEAHMSVKEGGEI